VTDAFRDELSRALGAGYTIDRELSGGGMSRVFVAVERALNRTVVVKVLKPDLAAEVNRERFRREIMVVAQLHHPHIVPVLNAGEHGDLLWFTMPFVEGESLREEIRKGRTMSAREVARVLHDVLDALDYAHTRGVIHRDIKPGNILRHRAHSLVTDFGVAKALSAALPHSGATSAGIAIGTPAYMAPEQLAADPKADHRLDLYAVGLLGYELFTGMQPFAESSPQATMAAQLTRMPRPLSELRPDIPAPLAGLIMRLLAKAPDDRPASAAAALEELEALTTPADVTAPASGWGGTPPPRGRRAALIGLAAAVVVAVVAFATTRGSSDRATVVVPTPNTSTKAGADSASVGGTAAKAAAAASVAPGTAAPGTATKTRTAAGGGASSQTTSTTTKAPRATPAAKTAATPGAGTGSAAATRPLTAQRGSGSGAASSVAPTRRFTPARRVAVIPARYTASRVDLLPAARALSDSLRKAFVAAGYELATDAELVQLLSQPGGAPQRRIAEASGIGAVVSTDLVVRGSEVRAQTIILDIWRNSHLSAVESADLDKPLEALAVVRNAARSLDRVSWRTRSDPRAVIVFDFDNLTGVDSLAALADRMAAAVRGAVARDLNVAVITDSAARATRDVTERREVGTRVRAGALVAGSVLRARSDSVTVRLSARDLTEENTFDTIEARVPMASAVESLAPAIARLIETMRRVNWGPKGGL
jgi:TolB-like protein